jgi:hypothetical protein
MKFSESWLRTLVDTKLSSEELSHLLTMAGLEVEGLDPVAPNSTTSSSPMCSKSSSIRMPTV